MLLRNKSRHLQRGRHFGEGHAKNDEVHAWVQEALQGVKDKVFQRPISDDE